MFVSHFSFYLSCSYVSKLSMTSVVLLLISAFWGSQICGVLHKNCTLCVCFPFLSPHTSSFTQHKHNTTMSSYHPDGLTFDIVGIIASDGSRNCKDHPFCGEIVALDIVVCFRLGMIHIAGEGGFGDFYFYEMLLGGWL
jgi:hypothetical protein